MNEFSDYVDDIEMLFEVVRAEHSVVHIIGQSLGGGIGAHLAIRLGNKCSSCILAAPMLSLEENKKKNKNVLMVLSALNYVVPWLPVGSKVINPYYPQMSEEFQQDELTYSGMIRVRVGVELLKAVDHVEEKAHEIVCPLLLLHSERDTLCEPRGSKMLFNKAKSSIKQLEMFPQSDDLWHAILSEPECAKVFQKITQFITNLNN